MDVSDPVSQVELFLGISSRLIELFQWVKEKQWGEIPKKVGEPGFIPGPLFFRIPALCENFRHSPHMALLASARISALR